MLIQLDCIMHMSQIPIMKLDTQNLTILNFEYM